MKLLPGAKVLPITVAASGLLLILKSMSLGQAAFAERAGPPPAVEPHFSEPAAQTPGSSRDGTRAASVNTIEPTITPTRTGTASHSAETSLVTDGPDAARDKFSVQLQRRADELESRRILLDAREAALATATDALRKRVTELDALKAQLQGLEERRKATDEQSWTGLVRIYESMRPANAAAIFDLLDTRVLLQVLDRMNDRKAAVILADMLPERARLATQLLAQMRLKSNADGKPAASASVSAPG